MNLGTGKGKKNYTENKTNVIFELEEQRPNFMRYVLSKVS